MAYQNVIVNLPQLETGNFSNWKFRVETLLDEKGVKDVLVKKEEVFNDNDEKVAFTKRDVQARSLIIRCISDKYLDLVKDLKTAYSKLVDHFLKFDKLIRDLEQAGSKLDESDKICHLLLIRDLEQAGSKLDESDKI
ncbi:Sugar transporter [Popillia japonica]|uniref:Sugar transporter n=1 Tax=Popillia japonica TaxID=7064 RepID=A0AAW1LZ05_POPJA